jgi:hypothetical protein
LGVHQQSKRQRQAGLPRRIADGLRRSVLIQQEIVLREIGHHFALLVAHCGEEIDHLDGMEKPGGGFCCCARTSRLAGIEPSAASKLRLDRLAIS